MSTDVMIHADNLTKMFGSLTALDRVSFDVRKGEVVGLSFLVELDFLHGRDRLVGRRVTSVIRY